MLKVLTKALYDVLGVFQESIRSFQKETGVPVGNDTTTYDLLYMGDPNLSLERFDMKYLIELIKLGKIKFKPVHKTYGNFGSGSGWKWNHIEYIKDYGAGGSYSFFYVDGTDIIDKINRQDFWEFLDLVDTK